MFKGFRGLRFSVYGGLGFVCLGRLFLRQDLPQRSRCLTLEEVTLERPGFPVGV